MQPSRLSSYQGDNMEELAAATWAKLEEKQRQREGQRRGTGLELKFPAVQANGEAIRMEQLQELWTFLADAGWQPIIDPYYETAVAVERPGTHCPDVIGTETGRCKLEVSLSYQEDIFRLQAELVEVRETLSEFGRQTGVSFLGLGIQPLTPPARELMMPKARNLFWEQVFSNGRVDIFTVTATNQVHVDVAPEEAVPAVNVFNGLAAAEIALNANSTVWKGQVETGYKALAEQAWEWWLPGSPRVGQTVRPFRDLEDYVAHLASYRPVYIVRDGQYLGLAGYPSFASYWQEVAGAEVVDAEGDAVTVMPALEDWELHQTFCWHDARLSAYGTLENRVNCEQPPEEIMVAAALTLGIMENLGEASRLAEEYSWEELARARQEAICRGMEAAVAGQPVTTLCRQVLEMAVAGLQARGLGEEVFLDPLWERLERKECPADRVRKVAARQGVEGLVKEFSWAPYKRG